MHCKVLQALMDCIIKDRMIWTSLIISARLPYEFEQTYFNE